MGTREIARKLADDGAPLPTMNRGEGGWTSRLVRHILRKETYCGVWYAYVFKSVGKHKLEKRPVEERVPIPVPAIVSRTLWEQAAHRKASRHIGRDQLSQYLMSSRIDCTCSVAVKGQRATNHYTAKDAASDFQHKIYLYYRCGSRETLKGHCGLPKYDAPKVDQLIWEFALELIDEEADFDAKRALIDILNITATLRVDQDGAKWVDIHWLAKTYPRIVDPAKHNPSPSCQACSAGCGPK